MRRRGYLFLAAMLCADVSAAAAPALPTVAIDLAHFGYTSAVRSDAAGCIVALTLDERVFRTHAAEIKQLGVLDPRAVPDRLDEMPNALALSFMLQVAPSVTQSLYRREAIDACRFTQYLASTSLEGAPLTSEVFSYSFDRAHFDAADWAALTAEHFVRTAPNFHFDLVFQHRLYGEFYRR